MINLKLISEFRGEVSTPGWCYYKYRNNNNRNQWNCICSAMDWIEVSINYIVDHPLSSIGDYQSIEVNDFKKKYDVIYDRAGSNHYIVRFKTKDAFNEFKKYALELSCPYYVFEGDVEKVIQIRREYHGIVELEPLDSFDVTSTLAKILGLRTDY